MSGYIKKDLLISSLEDCNESERMKYMGVFDVIIKQPEADVVEVKHGKWVNAYSSGIHLCRCSECGEYIETVWTEGYDFKYCPNCGARMNGE